MTHEDNPGEFVNPRVQTGICLIPCSRFLDNPSLAIYYNLMFSLRYLLILKVRPVLWFQESFVLIQNINLDESALYKVTILKRPQMPVPCCV